MLDFFLSAFFIVATAVVYTEVLTPPGMILAWWDKLIHDHIEKEWILKPLVDCVYCVGGQMALWSYPVIFWGEYSAILHFCFIMTVLFIINLYKYGTEKIAV